MSLTQLLVDEAAGNQGQARPVRPSLDLRRQAGPKKLSRVLWIPEHEPNESVMRLITHTPIRRRSGTLGYSQKDQPSAGAGESRPVGGGGSSLARLSSATVHAHDRQWELGQPGSSRANESGAGAPHSKTSDRAANESGADAPHSKTSECRTPKMPRHALLLRTTMLDGSAAPRSVRRTRRRFGVRCEAPLYLGECAARILRGLHQIEASHHPKTFNAAAGYAIFLRKRAMLRRRRAKAQMRSPRKCSNRSAKSAPRRMMPRRISRK